MNRGYIISSVAFVLAITSVIFVNNLVRSQAGINDGIEGNMRIDAAYNAMSDLRSSISATIEYGLNDMSIDTSKDNYCNNIVTNFNNGNWFSDLFNPMLSTLIMKYDDKGVTITPSDNFRPTIHKKSPADCILVVTVQQSVEIKADGFFSKTLDNANFGTIEFIVNPDGSVTRYYGY